MILINKFFCVNYWITSFVFKNKSYPLFSTILVLTLYEFFALLFIFDFVAFQILGQRGMIINRNMLIGFIIMTIILLYNYFYFTLKGRYLNILIDFKKDDNKNRIYSFVFSITLMLIIIILNIYSVYSIRNNIIWF